MGFDFPDLLHQTVGYLVGVAALGFRLEGVWLSE